MPTGKGKGCILLPNLTINRKKQNESIEKKSRHMHGRDKKENASSLWKLRMMMMK
jgi:hypothetical protein